MLLPLRLNLSGGSAGVKVKIKPEPQKVQQTRNRIKDDEEVLSVIKVFMELQ